MKGYCESCDTSNIEVKEYENGMPRRKAKLCKICASSLIGNAFFYPSLYDKSLYSTLGRIANILLSEIKKQGGHR